METEKPKINMVNTKRLQANVDVLNKLIARQLKLSPKELEDMVTKELNGEDWFR